MELFADKVSEFFPVGESISGTPIEWSVGVIVVVVAGSFRGVVVLVAEMYPPILCFSPEKGRSEHYHERRVLHVVVLEDFDVGFTVS